MSLSSTVAANRHIQNWVKDMAAMCQPDEVFWCDGSEEEKEKLVEVAVKTETAKEKFALTSVGYKEGNNHEIKDISLGGTTTRLVFE